MIGNPLVHLSVVSSTNDVAKELAAQGCPEGTAVLADYQTAGRGRLGRAWIAPPHSGLLLSVVFRPALAPGDIHRLTMICGLAVVRAVYTEVGLEVRLKWPNDIVFDGKKLGGILAEAAVQGDRVEYCVVGIGMNVQLEVGAIGGELAMPATSLSQESGQVVPVETLAARVLAEIEARYTSLQHGWSPHREWASCLTTLGHRVVVSDGVQSWEGVACDVDPMGSLLVRGEDGKVERVLAKDVTLRG